MLYKNEVMKSPVANEMRDQAQVLRAQGMLPSRAAQAGDGSGAPINQQRFASDTAQSVIGGKGGPSLPDPSPMYVPGLGTLGPDAGGWLKGVQAAQDMQLKAAANTRAEEGLGLDKAKFGLAQDYYNLAQADLGIKLDAASQQRQKFDIDMNLMDGMSQAAEQGGYTGVIDYLKTANPGLAVQFHQQKLALDDNILKNDVMQRMAPAMKAQALFDTYAVGAKMAAGILKLPPEQREAAAREALPMFKQLDPSFPTELNTEAISKMELMLFQGTPENMVFANTQGANQKLAVMGEKYLGYESMVQRYGINSQQAQDAKLEIDALRGQYQEKTMAATKAKLDISGKITDNVAKLATMTKDAVQGLNKDSEPYLKEMESVAKVIPVAKQVLDMKLKGIPLQDSAAGRQLIAFAAAKANSGEGPMSNEDFTNTQTDYGFTSILQEVRSFYEGKQVKLSDEALYQIAAINLTKAKRLQGKQIEREDSYRKMYSKFTIPDEDGNQTPAIQWDDLPKPSQKFSQMLGDQKEAGDSQYPEPHPNDILYIKKYPSVKAMKQFQQTYGTDNLFRYLGNQ